MMASIKYWTLKASPALMYPMANRRAKAMMSTNKGGWVGKI
jgi:hypothetical protein